MFPNQINNNNQKLLLPGLIFLAWTLYGLFFASQNYVRQAYIGNNPDFQRSLSVWLTCGYSWAILTPVILFFARRFSFGRDRWLQALLFHAPAAIVFSALALSIFASLRILLGEVYTVGKYKDLLIGEIHAGVLVYLAAVGVAQILRYLRSSADQPAASETKAAVIDVMTDAETSGNGIHTTDGAFELKELNKAPYPERFSVKKNGRIVFVNVDDIDRIASDGNYVRIYTNGQSHLLRETMKGIEQRLDPKSFLRVRRSTIVRIEQIKELLPVSNSEFEVVLKNGTKVISSRRYRRNLDSILKA